MTHRLPSVLSHADLPIPELLAARLDGEVFRVDGCFSPVDEILQPHHRALAVRAGISERLIAEQRTAAWIWGALDDPPSRHQLCATLGARVAHPPPYGAAIREVVIESFEVTTIAGLQVTTPLRTAVDLARFSEDYGPLESSIVSRLALVGRFGIADCLADIQRRRNLPGKKRAIVRLTTPHS